MATSTLTNTKVFNGKETRSKSDIWLIGTISQSIIQLKKLPSLRETLSVFFYHHIKEQHTLRKSADLTVKEVFQIWEKAGIPTARSYDVATRIINYHAEWQRLKKLINRRNDKQIAKEHEFSERLEQLFDIAHHNAEELIKIPEDWAFLRAQRDGRKGYIAGKDKLLAKKLDRIKKRKVSQEKRQEKSQNDIANLTRTVELDSSSSNEESLHEEDKSEVEDVGLLSANASEKQKKHKSTDSSGVVTPTIAAALDRTKVTDREATHILAATAQALGGDVESLPLSRSSIRRARLQFREERARQINHNFKPETQLVVHWDGKLLPDLTNKAKVDRLPVIVSGEGIEQLLGVPKISSCTGKAQADAVKKCLEDWNLSHNIIGMSFDTTVSNTGEHSGACTLLEKALGHDVLHLPCRHHILEIVAEKAFTAMKIAPSTGPDIVIFRRFQEKWPYIDQDTFETAAESVEIADFKDHIIDFAKMNLAKYHNRDDYKELLELIIIFLGGMPSRGIHFQAPGAVHRARWMARIIYSFKMWMFRSQFTLKPVEEKGIFQFLLFTSEVYSQAWFEAPSSVSAPANDLRLLHSLIEYRNMNIRKASGDAFKRHLWYLSETLIGLAFFDPNVSTKDKKEMVKNLNEEPGSSVHSIRRLNTKQDIVKPLSAYVTKRSIAFFKILKLNTSFLSKPPEFWNDDEDYCSAERVARALRVVNDAAERGVQLMQDYNAILTHDEDQKQYLLQVVQQHRRIFPDSNKKTILAGLRTSEAV